MKKLIPSFVFALSLLSVLTFTVGAFPGMDYSGDANATNINVTLEIPEILFINPATSATVIVGDASSDASGTLVDMMETSGTSTAAKVEGSVLGLPINIPISEIESAQSYLNPGEFNPDTAIGSLIGINESLLSLGVINNNTMAELRGASREPSLIDPTSSLSESSSEIADVGVALPLLPILSADGVTATTNVETTDVSTVVAQGYDAISCNAQSVVAGLDVLGLVSVDAITTTTSATVNGKDGDVSASVVIVGLNVNGTGSDPIVLDLNNAEPIQYNLLAGAILLTLGPDLAGSADANNATASATALRLEVLADVGLLGVGAGTVVEVGATDVTCSTARGNWNPADDTDGDGVIDRNDLDDDNDGLPDVLEGSAAIDTDGDGIPDSRDLDSDNDGANDVQEAGHSDLDLNGDGQIDGVVGTNGLSDLVEVSDTLGTALNYIPLDTDGDNVLDVRDLDSDNDSIPDLVENGFAANDANDDAMLDGDDDDFDGIIAPADGLNLYGDNNDKTPLDTDSDGVPNSRDLDSDNDGTLDLIENGQGALDTDDDGMVNGSDDDGDGILGDIDTRPAIYGSGVNVVNSDNDDIFNAYDLDSDNDGATDVFEAGLQAFDVDGTGMLEGNDEDNDGVPDTWDTMPDTYGAGAGELPDADDDGQPDMVEIDSDDDGTYDCDIYGVGEDLDGDGQVDGDDSDRDGIPSSADNAPTVYGLQNVPTAVSLSGHSTQTFGQPALLLVILILLGTASKVAMRD